MLLNVHGESTVEGKGTSVFNAYNVEATLEQMTANEIHSRIMPLLVTERGYIQPGNAAAQDDHDDAGEWESYDVRDSEDSDGGAGFSQAHYLIDTESRPPHSRAALPRELKRIHHNPGFKTKYNILTELINFMPSVEELRVIFAEDRKRTILGELQTLYLILILFSQNPRHYLSIEDFVSRLIGTETRRSTFTIPLSRIMITPHGKRGGLGTWDYFVPSGSLGDIMQWPVGAFMGWSCLWNTRFFRRTKTQIQRL